MRTILQALAAVVAALLLVPSPAQAQATGGDVKLSAEFTAATENRPARLYVTAEIEEGWHIFSVTQKKGGPLRTTIRLAESDQYRLLEETFAASPPPAVRRYPDVWPDLDIEEHEGTVTWYARIELADGVDPSDVKIEGTVRAQRCDPNACLPPKGFTFTAALGDGVEVDERLAATASAPASGEQPAAEPVGDPRTPPEGVSVGTYVAPEVKAAIEGHVFPAIVEPGEKVTLSLRARPDSGWHVYAFAARPRQGEGPQPTLIHIAVPEGWTASAPVADSQPHQPLGLQADSLSYHEGAVTWTVEFAVPAGAEPGVHRIRGIVGFQTCDNNICLRPQGVLFSAEVAVGAPGIAQEVPLSFLKSSYAAAEGVAGGEPLPPFAGVAVDGGPPSPTRTLRAGGLDPELIRQYIAAKDEEEQSSLPVMLVFAFLGGLILNLMPCVLPVIGLKIMSFVQQSGQDRRQVLALNVWYSAGIIVVFMGLATLASAANLGLSEESFGWGELFRYAEFNIALAALVFVMGLSFLGVWEIPIPGFVGSGKANDLASQEGAAGAFSKGVLTTVLATPCTGPFLASALAFAVRQPPAVIFTIFACVGLGMASPYLVLGAFPSLLRFLPKPGAWMDTFKQLMGFVLLGTVVYLFTLIPWAYVVPTLALLIGLWLACWLIGRIPFTAAPSAKARTWCLAATLAMLSGLIAFNWLDDVMAARYASDVNRRVASVLNKDSTPKVARGEHELPWQPFSWDELDGLVRDRRTVMVDFTADWCLTCKTLERLVLNTDGTKKVVETHAVVPLIADWTDFEDNVEVTEMLDVLGGKQVPTLAIFPAGRPNEPIVLRGAYTARQLAEILEKASRGVSQASPDSIATTGREP